jgi:hypothetical protein
MPAIRQMSTLMSTTVVCWFDVVMAAHTQIEASIAPGVQAPLPDGFPLALSWAASFGILPTVRAAGKRGERNSSPQLGALFALGD